MAKKRRRKHNQKNNSSVPELRKEDKEKSKSFIYLLFALLGIIALIFVALQSM